MDWKLVTALTALYLAGVMSGMGLAFRIDAHLAVMTHLGRNT